MPELYTPTRRLIEAIDERLPRVCNELVSAVHAIVQKKTVVTPSVVRRAADGDAAARAPRASFGGGGCNIRSRRRCATKLAFPIAGWLPSR